MAVLGQIQVIPIMLESQSAIEEHVTVSATRTDKRIEDQSHGVEVLDAEEIDEKPLMRPGDIVMMQNEMGGLRVQATYRTEFWIEPEVIAPRIVNPTLRHVSAHRNASTALSINS